MTTRQRLFQAMLFEILAVLLSLGWVKLLSIWGVGIHPVANSGQVLFMLIAISIIAMVWTFFYNLLFDKVFTGNKLARPLWLRALHILGFEGGLLLFTLPLVMWVMRLTLLQAFLLDISITLMILVYGFVFYWVYDWISDKFFT
jgi:uncharacterized membrane protein